MLATTLLSGKLALAELHEVWGLHIALRALAKQDTSIQKDRLPGQQAQQAETATIGLTTCMPPWAIGIADRPRPQSLSFRPLLTEALAVKVLASGKRQAGKQPVLMRAVSPK